jgi:hypothetical protein
MLTFPQGGRFIINEYKNKKRLRKISNINWRDVFSKRFQLNVKKKAEKQANLNFVQYQLGKENLNDGSTKEI